MPLEEEALRENPLREPGRLTRPRPFDGVVRGLALLVLVAALTFVYWVPFQYLGPGGAAVVLAALTVLGVALASRLRHLRKRLDDLESRLAAPPQK